MKTKERIFNKALEMFNEQGIEYVGVRELAAALDMSVGNVGYYFSKKEDLVSEVARQLNVANSASFGNLAEVNSLQDFMQRMKEVFHNHVRFRCLLLSFVNVVKQYKGAAEGYRKTSKIRRATIEDGIKQLVAIGSIRNTFSDEELKNIGACLNIIGRFWVSDAAVMQAGKSDDAQVNHYIRLVAIYFKPYVTAKGKRELEAFVAGL